MPMLLEANLFYSDMCKVHCQ